VLITRAQNRAARMMEAGLSLSDASVPFVPAKAGTQRFVAKTRFPLPRERTEYVAADE
jgi:hypothetical protein